jgi:hypothetical protein
LINWTRLTLDEKKAALHLELVAQGLSEAGADCVTDRATEANIDALLEMVYVAPVTKIASRRECTAGANRNEMAGRRA